TGDEFEEVVDEFNKIPGMVNRGSKDFG
ncbi:MAG: hypothetical protein UV67_C0037G0001, partial [Parcubacteria group bacterium GW2011_GWC1_43_12]